MLERHLCPFGLSYLWIWIWKLLVLESPPKIKSEFQKVNWFDTANCKCGSDSLNHVIDRWPVQGFFMLCFLEQTQSLSGPWIQIRRQHAATDYAVQIVNGTGDLLQEQENLLRKSFVSRLSLISLKSMALIYSWPFNNLHLDISEKKETKVTSEMKHINLSISM